MNEPESALLDFHAIAAGGNTSEVIKTAVPGYHLASGTVIDVNQTNGRSGNLGATLVSDRTADSGRFRLAVRVESGTSGKGATG